MNVPNDGMRVHAAMGIDDHQGNSHFLRKGNRTEAASLTFGRYLMAATIPTGGATKENSRPELDKVALPI
jgi:hypothetical protein